MFKRALAAGGAACALTIAGCGTSHHQSLGSAVRISRPVTLSQACPPGQSYMGCSIKTAPKALLNPTATAPPQGPLFPDVSDWQGPITPTGVRTAGVNWQAVAAWQHAHGWQPYGIEKLGEFSVDPDAAINAQRMRAAGMRVAGYWFVRNTGCSHEAAQIIAEANALRIKVVALDAEVPEARGYALCLPAPLHKAGLTVVEYTSPGTNPDSSNPGLDEWVAAYGPSLPCLFTCRVNTPGKQSILAWQCTDGRFGCVTDVPGIGREDVSVNFGLEQLSAPPAHHSTAWDKQFNSGFDRGYTVRWDELHHRRVPRAHGLVFGPGFNPGFRAGGRAASR